MCTVFDFIMAIIRYINWIIDVLNNTFESFLNSLDQPPRLRPPNHVNIETLPRPETLPGIDNPCNDKDLAVFVYKHIYKCIEEYNMVDLELDNHLDRFGYEICISDKNHDREYTIIIPTYIGPSSYSLWVRKYYKRLIHFESLDSMKDKIFRLICKINKVNKCRHIKPTRKN